MQHLRLLIITCLVGALLACGQKGPLVLPDAQHPRKKPTLPRPAAPPTPASAATPL